MANRIAEKIAKKRQDFSDELALNREIKITQNDLFWDDYIKRISNEFISSGEWLNRLITKARQNIAKDLEIIKPLIVLTFLQIISNYRLVILEHSPLR